MSFLDRFRKNEPQKSPLTDAPDTPSGVRHGGSSGPVERSESGPPATEASPDVSASLSDLDRLLDAVGQIDSIIGTDAGDETAHEVTLRLGVADICSLIPASSGVGLAPGAWDERTTVTVDIPDGLEQLARGQVSVTVDKLLEALPPGVVLNPGTVAQETRVEVPLPMVVNAIDPDALKRQASRPVRETGLESVPDPFGRREDLETAAAPEPPAPVPTPEPPAPAPEAAPEPPVPVLVPKPPTPTPAPAPVPTPAPPAPSPMPEPPAPVPEPPTPVPTPEPPAPVPMPKPPTLVSRPVEALAEAPCLHVRGIDLNRADVRALVRALPGVGPLLAGRLASARPFRSVYDLALVPGIGRRQFVRMTGEHLPPSGPTAALIEQVLGSADQPLPALSEVARRMVSLPGIHGALLSHMEGHILALDRVNRKHRNLGAVAPQIVKMLDKYLEALKLDPPQSLTLHMEPRPIHIVRRENILLIVSLSRSRVSIRRIQILENLVGEIVRRLHAVRGPAGGKDAVEPGGPPPPA